MSAVWLALVISAGAVVVLALAYALLVRPWILRWGATREELRSALPGDSIVPRPTHHDAHAITVRVPVSELWPWVAQIGQGRGGLYSYEWLENLAGCRIRNVDRIVPELQDIKPGDKVRLHPKAPALVASIVLPPHTLVLGDKNGTWSFNLRPVDASTTRLVVRSHWYWPGPVGWFGQHAVLEPAHFIMERKMLKSIKSLAEGAFEQAGRRAPEKVA